MGTQAGLKIHRCISWPGVGVCVALILGARPFTRAGPFAADKWLYFTMIASEHGQSSMLPALGGNHSCLALSMALFGILCPKEDKEDGMSSQAQQFFTLAL